MQLSPKILNNDLVQGTLEVCYTDENEWFSGTICPIHSPIGRTENHFHSQHLVQFYSVVRFAHSNHRRITGVRWEKKQKIHWT